MKSWGKNAEIDKQAN